MATGTSGTVAAGSALAVAIILRSRNLNDTVVEALFGLNDVNSIGVAFLHALALVSAVAVAAGRHGDGWIEIEREEIWK
ncbi:hypothetical protein INO82_14305 [Staphylococcus aureus]|nr:hypothetical protein [Staphylococcus aureus]MBO8907863.1 hypothetical protein [Staphylococcus aureus]